jgi:hypothetical protein
VALKLELVLIPSYQQSIFPCRPLNEHMIVVT